MQLKMTISQNYSRVNKMNVIQKNNGKKMIVWTHGWKKEDKIPFLNS